MEERMTYKLSLRLFKGEKCFGPGIAELLSLVESERSLRAAAAHMGMAYSKAWRIMKQTETALGVRFIESTTGGHNGGGAVLTPEGKAMLDKYAELMQKLNLEAEALVDGLFNQEP